MKSLESLVDELEQLDLEEQGARFVDIVAELANHAEELLARFPGLATSLTHQHRCAVAEVLAHRARPQDVPVILGLLDDAHPQVRRAAARALAKFPRPEPRAQVVAALGSRLRDADSRVVAAALEALGALGERAATAAIVAVTVLEHPAWEVRQAACEALRALGDPAALVPLIGRLGDADDDVKNSASQGLAVLLPRLADPELDAAVAALDDDAAKQAHTTLADGDAPSGRAALPRLAGALGRRAATLVAGDQLGEFGKVLLGDPRGEPLAPTFERDALVDDLLELLAKDGNKSFVLVGKPGVGKTAVIHELARRLTRAAQPWVVLETSTPEIMVGTKYIGEWETKLRDLIGKVKAPRRVLVYLTNVNDMGGAGTTSSNKANFGSLLAPYLRRGEVTVIGEATAQALQLGLEKDGSLKRLFRYVQVAEPDEAAVARILRLQVGELSRRVGADVVVAQDVLDLIVELSGTYYAGQAQPGRSVTLLNQVVEHRIEQQPPEDGVSALMEVGAEDVIGALARFTGLPERLLNDRRPLDPNDVRAFFEERVLGQPEAVGAVVDLITLVKAALTDPGKPLGVLFFVGPTGVGKTEIAKTLAEFIFGSAERLLRIDLSEYKDFDSFEKLIGGTYRNQEGGQLTTKVREQPFSVILLDEFEKAHANIFDLFLQVFDDGRLTDARGSTADFRHTIIVMTSNLGSGIGGGGGGGGLGFGSTDGDQVPSEEKVLKEVRKFFRPEFINRLDKIVVFRPLAPDVMRMIVQRELGKVVLRSGILRRRLLVDLEPQVVDLLMREGFSVAYGARPLKRRVEQLVLLPLAREIVAMGPEDRGSLLKVRVDNDKIVVKRVRTREASREDEVAERLRLRSWASDQERAVKPGDLPAVLAQLRARLVRLTALAEGQSFRERKSQIVTETSAVTFWDDPPRARRTLAELAHLEVVLEGLDGASRQLDDLNELAAAYGRHGSRLRSRFEAAHATFLERLIQLEYKFLGEKPDDRRDVFLSLARIGVGREDADALEQLERMYLSWAERRGFRTTPLNRRADDVGAAEAIWLLEGISLYGLIKGEDGLHRFELGGKGSERQAAFVRVDVLPAGDGERRIVRKDVKVTRGARGGAILVHQPSGTSVESSATPVSDELEELLVDLLDARIAAHTTGAGSGMTVDRERVVRRYNPAAHWIRDEETGFKTARVKEVLGGSLDELLRPRLFGTV